MDVGGGEHEEGKEKLGAFVESLGKRTGKNKGVGDVIKGDGAGGNYFRVGDGGDEPPHGPGSGGVSAQGGQTDYREAALSYSVWNMGVPPIGGGNTGGGV